MCVCVYVVRAVEVKSWAELLKSDRLTEGERKCELEREREGGGGEKQDIETVIGCCFSVWNAVYSL